MGLFSKYVCFVAIGFLSACSTISNPSNNSSGYHPRDGKVYKSCVEAAKALNATFKGEEKDSLGKKKIAYMHPKGPRCDVTNHVFAVNKHGILRATYDTKKETPDSLLNVEKGLREYFKCPEATPDCKKRSDNKILIFIHGGLVSHRLAVSEAEIAAPWIIRDGYYPIFLVWDSSLNSSYIDYLANTTDGERNRLLSDDKDKDRDIQNDDEGANDDGVIKRSLLATTRVIGDLGTGIFKAPENYIIQFDNYWERNSNNDNSPYRLNLKDFPKRSDLDQNSNEEYWLDVRQIEHTRDLHRIIKFPELDFMRENNIDLNTGASWIAPSEYPYHALMPVRIATTGLSEVGRNSWDNMVRRTRLAVVSPEHLSQAVRSAKTAQDRVDVKGEILANAASPAPKIVDCQYVHDRAKKTKIQKYGGFAHAMELVSCLGQNNTIPSNTKVTLAGHSMGAIVANEILWSYPELNYNRIIYMAPAGSMRDFNRIALPVIRQKAYPDYPDYIAESPNIEFYSLMLHPFAEARERMGKGIPPQGSLLEWIDEMFEGPRNFEEKTLGKYRNIRRLIYSYNDLDRAFLNLRVFPVQDKFMDADKRKILPPLCDADHLPTETLGRCHPLKHGEVNDFTFWREPYLGID